LNRLGYNVPAIALTGTEAIKKTEEFNPDLVLMDIGLKGDMDGIEAAANLCRPECRTRNIKNIEDCFLDMNPSTEKNKENETGERTDRSGYGRHVYRFFYRPKRMYFYSKNSLYTRQSGRSHP